MKALSRPLTCISPYVYALVPVTSIPLNAVAATRLGQIASVLGR